MVPGRHEMILPPKFKESVCGDGVLGIVEPSPGLAEQHDLLLARVAQAPVTLYQTTSVGTFQ